MVRGDTNSTIPTITAVGDSSSSSSSSSDDTAPHGSGAKKNTTGFVGLVNQGATCYLNSLLQVLYHLGSFRSAVYRMPVHDDKGSTLPKALQNVFYQMQERSTAASTKVLTNAFGWSEREVMIQHDIQELATKLRDTLTSKMKGTPQENVNKDLFQGEQENIIECCDGSYTSRSKSVYYDLQLEVRRHRDVYSSFDALTKVEVLCGDNKYKIERDDGTPAEYKDANKFVRFVSFPPVLFLHLQRFEMDLMSPTLEMTKINDQYEYDEVLNLGKYLPPGTPPHLAMYDLYGVIVHGGTVRSGHYRAFIRPRVHVETAGETGGGEEVPPPQWGAWHEFDDDTVREVSRAAATTSMFGGTVVNAQGYTVQRSTNAYMLVYVRRQCVVEVLNNSCSTDEIPPGLKTELHEQLVQEEAEAHEREIKNSKVTFRIVTERMMYMDVLQHQWDLVSFQQTSRSDCLVETVEKRTRFNAIAEAVANRFQIPIHKQRYWPWAYHYPKYREGYRPNTPAFTMRDFGRSVYDLFKAAQSGDTGPWVIDLLLEAPAVYEPILFTDVAPSGVASASSQIQGYEAKCALLPMNDIDTYFLSQMEDDNPSWTLDLRRPYYIERVVLQNKENAPRLTEVTVELKSPSGQVTQQFMSNFSTGKKTVNVPLVFNGGNNDGFGFVAQYIRVSKSSPNLILSEVQVMVSASAGRLGPRQYAPVLPPVSPNTILLLVKTYNPMTPKLTYAGLLHVEESHHLSQYYPQLRRYLNVDDSTELSVMEEARYQLALEVDPHMPIRNTSLRQGNVIVVQPVLLPTQQSAHPYMLSYFKFLSNRRMVHVYNIDEPLREVTFLELQAGNQFTDIVQKLGHALGELPTHLQLFGYDRLQDCPNEAPIFSYATTSLDQMLGSQWNALSSRDVCKLWYRSLTIPLAEMEAEALVTVDICDEKGEKVSQNPQRSASMDRRSTVNDLLLIFSFDPSTHNLLRIFRGVEIDKVYRNDDVIPCILPTDGLTLQIRPIPPRIPSIHPHDQHLVRVFHVHGKQMHSVPLQVWVGVAETFRALLNRVVALQPSTPATSELYVYSSHNYEYLRVDLTERIEDRLAYQSSNEQVAVSHAEKPGSRYVPRHEPVLKLADEKPSPIKEPPGEHL